MGRELPGMEGPVSEGMEGGPSGQRELPWTGPLEAEARSHLKEAKPGAGVGMRLGGQVRRAGGGFPEGAIAETERFSDDQA